MKRRAVKALVTSGMVAALCLSCAVAITSLTGCAGSDVKEPAKILPTMPPRAEDYVELSEQKPHKSFFSKLWPF
jgi:hypothetical protein